MKLTAVIFLASGAAYCYTPRQTTAKDPDSGLVLYKRATYNEKPGGLVSPVSSYNMKMWYLDSAVIQECPHENTAFNDNDAASLPVKHYAYIDLRKMWVYTYKTFSDTAAIISRVAQTENDPVEGGWNFYHTKRTVVHNTLQALNDTTMGGVIYRRLRSSTTNNNDKAGMDQVGILYLRDDKRNSIFHIDKQFDRQNGCLLARFERYTLWERPQVTVTELEFVRNGLTRRELEVFDAWEKNCRVWPPGGR